MKPMTKKSRNEVLYKDKLRMKISTDYENGTRNTYENQSEMVAMTDSTNHTARPGAMPVKQSRKDYKLQELEGVPGVKGLFEDWGKVWGKGGSVDR